MMIDADADDDGDDADDDGDDDDDDDDDDSDGYCSCKDMMMYISFEPVCFRCDPVHVCAK